MMAVPDDEVEVADEVKGKLTSKLINIANRRGIDWSFIADSKGIQDGIEQIADAMARICTKVKKDKQLIKDTVWLETSEEEMVEAIVNDKDIEIEMKAEKPKKRGK